MVLQQWRTEKAQLRHTWCELVWPVVRLEAGKQRDLSLNPLRLSFFLKSCGLWTLSCDFIPHNWWNIKMALITAHLNAGVILVSLMDSVDIKYHVYLHTWYFFLTCWPSLCHHWYWLLGTRWQCSVMFLHSCQPLLGVNLSPEFANLYFPYAGQGLLFFAGGNGILSSKWHVWQWKEEAMLC